jgi:hypothetical protein
MLPARSHVTSDGRLKASPLMQAPARRHAGARPQSDVLRLSAEHELEAAVGVELHDLVRSGVDDPDVVLRIDADLLREVDRVDALSDLLHELAGLIELKDARAVVIEGPFVAERRHGMAGARVDEDVPLRVRRHAGDFAVRRQREHVGVCVVIDVGHRLRADRRAERDEEQQCFHHGVLLSSAARGGRGRPQLDLLHAPRGDLGDVQIVGRAAVHLVDAAER